MTGNQIRQRFLDYFATNGHRIVSSSPLVPAQDPTLLFTNAGMVQFKGVFLGEERREYARATTCQKCVRAGGKHNDLENVGRTVRHHTFFEMLGNFSFGDYFKAEAVAFAWEFLTKEMGLPRDRLWATVFTDDDEALGLWQKVAGLKPDRILRLGEADNFWAMGETGPCGPCSEIHYHQGDHLPCVEVKAGRRCLGPACECDRWLEVWNLVFMQFNRDAAGTMTPLPKPSIDTGMGLERIAAIMQGKTSNFETDLLWPILEGAAKLARKTYGASEADDISLRVIADHARATTFLIADGVYPSNEWRGYVLRRIMRRAMRHGRILGLYEPFLWKAVEWVVTVMAGAYPELAREQPRIQEVVKTEEERFAETLDTGVAKIREYLEANRGAKERVADGRFLFTLYDTHGFPLDLAQEVFQEAGWSVPQASLDAYEAEMERQRERARASAAFGAEAEESAKLYGELSTQIRPPEFLGYESLATPARILVMVRAGHRLREAAAGDDVEVMLDRTPCYAESGGQIGDTGQLVGRQGRGRILDTYYRGSGLIVHRVHVEQGGLREGEDVAVSVESPRRQGLRLHHTGTHLLHAALRRVLGTHVTQAGSLVAPDHLRFDVTHPSQIRDRELEQVEEMVNEKVRDNLRVDPIQTDLEQALKMGALALFGEKYGQRVRVIKIGDFSTELCGGTHLEQTGQIGLFKVVSEGAVAAGVRRLTAVTGDAALHYVGREESALREAAGLLKIPPLELPQRLQKLLDGQRLLEKQLESMEGRLAKSRAQDLVAAARQIGGVAVVAARVDGLDQDGLRAVVDSVRDRLGSGVICLGSVKDDKVNLVAAVSKDLTPRFNAGKLIQEVARAVGGGGGGRPDLAQAGGKDPSKLDAALGLVHDWVVRSTST
ncbi:MAG: alanyl-tRNA synthetase, alanyl-tRNA synthetase [Candidatus Rokubacteria bacterium CSP1-6]|nr:MAG: alanyl-tRNA synthetase, alanyl-tRNA synthetase [Candidatus Rokubacteria bacterium CSP1-6]